MPLTIGILQTGRTTPELRGKHGAYTEMFDRLLHSADVSVRTVTFSILDEDFPKSPTDCDGWIVTGSKHGVYEDLPWIKPLEAFVRDCGEHKVPVVGICFGHQLLAQAYGGKVVKSNKGWGLAAYSSEIVSNEEWMTPEASEMSIRYIHQDQVVELPDNVDVFARHNFCPAAGLAYRDVPAISFQGHPEFSSSLVKDIMAQRRGGVMDEKTVDEAMDRLDMPTNESMVAMWILEFFTQHN